MNLFQNLTCRLLGRAAKHASPARKIGQGRQLRMESLESRQMMDGGLAPMLASMTELAAQYPTKAAPTMLYVNFDGSTSRNISAFASTNRDDDMQEILFRTSEMFAPFNVQVVRLFGNDSVSRTNGNTTVFVGNDASLTGFGGYTPWEFTDYPSGGTSYNHRINSHLFDIAIVDPMNGTAVASNLWTAQVIAHEAGHTFGLGHVLSSPAEDAMSYDATNAAFLNQDFSITNLNNNGRGMNVPNEDVVPVWYRKLPAINFGFGSFQFNLHEVYDIKLQNSFTTLTTLLGSNSTNRDSVANLSAVDPGFAARQVNLPLAVGRTLNGVLDRQGDYDVFTYVADRTGTLRVEVNNINGSFVAPTVMIYNPATGGMVEVASNALSNGRAEAVFNGVAGTSYRIIVGAQNGVSTGEYEVSLDAGRAAGAAASLSIASLATNLSGTSNSVRLENQSGHFRLVVNNAVVWSDQIKDLASVTVVGTSSPDNFTLVGEFPFQVSIAGGGGSDTLTGRGTENTWTLQALDRGQVAGTGGLVSFESIENLTGGAGADTFRFHLAGRVSGRISGGGGTDTLDYSSFGSAVAVDLSLGRATSTAGVSLVENITGSRYSDTLIGNSQANVIRGGAGDDTIYGRAGDDELFGEDGLDWLYGEAGADYLDGGADAYRDNLYGDAPGARDEADTYASHFLAVADYFARLANDQLYLGKKTR